MTKKPYKKNYITNFLVRLDFKGVLDSDGHEVMIESLRELFPNITKTIIAQESTENKIAINASERTPKPVNKKNESVYCTLYSSDRKMRISTSNNAVIFETLRYQSFSAITPIVEQIVSTLAHTYGVDNFLRLGIRYINLMRQKATSKKDILDWKKYIDSSMLHFENITVTKERILQTITSTDFCFDDNGELMCHLQYGIPNRNMPSSLVEKNFLLDLDGSTISSCEVDEAMPVLDRLHDGLEVIFEKCITKELRKEMNSE